MLPAFSLQKRRKQKLLIGKDQACLYTAPLSTTSQWPPPPRPSQVCVGIYDKKTGEVTLQPVADQGYVYALSQTVPTYQRKQDLKTMTAAERRKALFEDFGSAKKRRVMRSQEANQINAESVVGASVTTTSLPTMSESNRRAMEDHMDAKDNNDESARRETAVDKATVEWRKTFLPPYNESADAPAEVYSARQIAGPAVWSRLSRMVSKCLEKDNVLKAIVDGPERRDDGNDPAPASPSRRKRDEWQPSVLRILNLCTPKGDAAKSQLVCAVLLQHFLSLYVKLHARRHIGSVESDRPNFFGAPLEVGQRWLESFTTPTPGRTGEMGYVMSQANKDKCKVHLFLLALMAEGGSRLCSENINPLAKDLQIDPKDGAHLLRLAGCSVTLKGAERTMAALATPLKFPSTNLGGRRS
jgi:hypothetical protein